MWAPVLVSLLAGLSFVAEAATCRPKLPHVTLPYGTWQASKYEPKAEVFTFKNIRYAAPPTGNRRFARPEPPEPVQGIQDGSYGPACATSPAAGAVNKTLIYTSGSKEELPSQGHYDGTGIIYQAQGDAVVVVINYRVGILGWLGGSAAEEAKATNLGLYDQRAALQWVRDYIHLFGGDPSNVSTWGASAGSGSIMHHLMQKGGQRDPLFHKAVLSSPGFFPTWDLQGAQAFVETILGNVNCTADGFDCLRAADITDEDIPAFSPSPVPDGDFFERPPPLEFADGRYWKDLESIVVSHTANEGFPWSLFGTLETEDDLREWILSTFGNRSDLIPAIIEQYPASSANTPADRYEAMANDIVFYVYAGVYAVGEATHASDTYPMWYNPTLGLTDPLLTGTPELNDIYQAYIVSHARTGNVNSFRKPRTSIKWPKVLDSREDEINALKSTDLGFQVIRDTNGTRSTCDVWVDVYREIWDSGYD
ncbi:alpha/beta-hydrolase [Sarocladium strictum]